VPDPSLTIGEVARMTGLAPATLRVWESRYGFPEPVRSAGGQRAYRGEVVEQVRQVVADRSAGLALPAAIERVRIAAQKPGPSLHAMLRRRSPALPTHRLTKRGLSALTRAMEDEGHARAYRPTVVAAGFQEVRHFRSVETRWQDLSRGAGTALVFADFPQAGLSGDGPFEIPLSEDHTLRREWFLVWAGPRFTACLSGRELPGQASLPNPERVLETVWTVDAGLVREAAEAVCGLAAALVPGLSVPATVEVERRDSADDLALVYALTNRMVAYLAPVS
jgi:DNA-binding transcriptional MerR regulator